MKNHYRHVVLVQWANGNVEQFTVPETMPLHIGRGEPSGPVPIFAPDVGSSTVLIGSLIVHGDERPYWTVSRVPLLIQDLERDMLRYKCGSDELSENDARRVHALADYLTAHELLLELVENALASTDNWTLPDTCEMNIARARNMLQVLSANAHFLLTTPADRLDLMDLMRQDEPTGVPAVPSSSQPR